MRPSFLEHRSFASTSHAHSSLVGKLRRIIQTNEGRILDRGRSNQPWPAGAEAEADEAEADDAAAHFQLVAKLTNTNPTVSQLFKQTRAASSIGVAQISLGQLELRLRLMSCNQI